MLITLGADPELAVVNSKSKEIVPVCGLLGGTKDCPIYIHGGAYQEDNVTAEINISPVTSPDNFARSIFAVKNQVAALLEQKGYELSPIASHEFDLKTLKKHSGAMTFGCDPDYDYLSGKQMLRNVIGATLRTYGGHIHVGLGGEMTKQRQYHLAMAMELYVGIPSVILDNDRKRKEMYGQAGSYRPKEYGIEYRVPSNFWMKSKRLTYWAGFASHEAARASLNILELMEAIGGPHTMQHIINTHDVKGATRVIDMMGLPMPHHTLKDVANEFTNDPY